jgi:DNA polymerase III delta prime subunit
MVITDIQLYNKLRSKFGDKETQELVSFIRSEIKTEFMARRDTFLVKSDKTDIMLSLKADKADIINQMNRDKSEFLGLLNQTKIELHALISHTKNDLSDKIFEEKAALLRSVYIVGLVQFLAIVGAILAIISFTK